jgi:hypothetical protein
LEVDPMTGAKRNRLPSYRHHKSSGQGFVELNGHRHYLGKYELPESKERYHRLLAEWLANGRRLPVDPDDLTVIELIDRFWQHAKTYYRKPDGTHTSSLDSYRLALRPLKRLYALSNVVDFGPRALKTVRQEMLNADWSRGTINQAVNLVRAVFRWGVAEELVRPEVHTALLDLSP